MTAGALLEEHGLAQLHESWKNHGAFVPNPHGHPLAM